MREWAKAIWETMFQGKTAPEVWSRRDSKNWLLYELSMCLRYPELNYCAVPERWKCHEIGTIDYSSWLAARRKAEAKAEEKKRKREAATAAKQNPNTDDTEATRARKRGRTATAQPPPGQVTTSETTSSRPVLADAVTTARVPSHGPAVQPAQAAPGTTSSAPSGSVIGPLPDPNPLPPSTSPPLPSPPPPESPSIPALPSLLPLPTPPQSSAPAPLSSEQPGAPDQLPAAAAPVPESNADVSLLGLLRRGDQLRADALGGMVLPQPLPAAETTRPAAQPDASAAGSSSAGAASGAPGAPAGATGTRKVKPVKMAVMPEGTQQLRSVVMRHFLTTHLNGPDRVPQDEWLAHWSKHEKDVQYLEPFRAQIVSAKRAKRADASSG